MADLARLLLANDKKRLTAKREQEFVEELMTRWGHPIKYVEETVNNAKSRDSTHRAHLCVTGVAFSILGAQGSGSDFGAARISAIKNFVQRLKSSYIPVEVLTCVRENGAENPYIDDVIVVLQHLEHVLSASKLYRSLPDHPTNSMPNAKMLAKQALLTMRPFICEYWSSKGMYVGPPTKEKPAKAQPSNEPVQRESEKRRNEGPPTKEKPAKAQPSNEPVQRESEKRRNEDQSEKPVDKRARMENISVTSSTAKTSKEPEVLVISDTDEDEQPVVEGVSRILTVTVEDSDGERGVQSGVRKNGRRKESTTDEEDDDMSEGEREMPAKVDIALNTSTISGPAHNSPSIEIIEHRKPKVASTQLPCTSVSGPSPVSGAAYNYPVLLGVTPHKQAAQWMNSVRQYRERHREAFDDFDERIWRHYRVNRQNDKIYGWKMRVRQLIQEAVQLIRPRTSINVLAVGSTVNGCGSYNSDMDLCICIPSYDGQYTPDKSFAKRALRELYRLLRYQPHRMRNPIPIQKIILIDSAKVPIIKLELAGEYQDLEVDMNVNNVAGVYNSHLFHYYAKLDDRFPALCLIVKHWAIVNDINDAMTGTFNSYSLLNMCVHYLHCGVSPPVLPNIQYLFPEKFARMQSLHELYLFQELDSLPEYPRNEQTIGELLIGFFHYYANFQFEDEAISILEGKTFSRSLLPGEMERFKIFIEEPFDRINTARVITRHNNYLKIVQAFQHASHCYSHDAPILDAVGVHVPDLPVADLPPHHSH